MLGDPSVLQAQNMHLLLLEAPPRRWHASEGALMGAGVDDAHRHPVALSHHVSDFVAIIGEGGAEHAHEPAQALRAAGGVRWCGVVDPVCGYELVGQLQVALVEDLLIEAADNGLVLFLGHEM